MQIYRGTLELQDYVFYATVERGKIYETGPFIHNYALTYALGLARGETYTYASRKQQPHYLEELTPLNGHLYLTPAAPQHLTYRLTQWNTIREGYAFPGKARSAGYPDWGFAKVLRPGSRFIFYVLVHDLATIAPSPALRDLLEGKAVRVRLGKFPGKVRLRAEVAEKVTEREGAFRVDAYLNWRDLVADPAACDIVATSLPTRLLARAYFREGPYLEARFGEEIVRFPLHMHFLARAPQRRRGMKHRR